MNKSKAFAVFAAILTLIVLVAAGPSIFSVYQGGTGLGAVAVHQVIVGTASNVYTAKTLPNCTDTSGNHLNYTQSGDTWSCGTSGSVSTPVSVANGGTGSSTLTAHSMLLGEGTSALSFLLLGAHQVAVGGSSADPSAKTIPDCQDTGGNHLNYTQSSDAFSCGTSSGGGGGGSSVPTYGGAYCTASSAIGTNAAIACNSVYNVAANHIIVALCGNTQTGTTTFADSGPGGGSPLTWTQIATVSNGGNSASETAWWANPGSATGADTFTCSYASSPGFEGLVVAEILGASASSPIDVSTTKSGAASQQINMTPTSTSDLVFVGLQNSGTATMPVGFFLALNATATANAVGWGPVGPYHFQLGMGTNGAAVAFAIH